MNRADRSIALVDHALRRRFSFVTLGVEYDILSGSLDQRNIDGTGFVRILKRINDEIGDPNYHLGISYFMNPDVDLEKNIEEIWRGEIEPYLDELFYGQSKEFQYRWEELEEQFSATLAG
jgi:5-methylcytosine-specific restriction protein B